MTAKKGKTTHYKIRRSDDNQYSTGGSSPYWSKVGKTWKSMKDLRAHLNIVHSWSGGRHPYDDCVLVTFEVTIQETGTESLSGVLNDLTVRNEARKHAQLSKRHRSEIRRLESELDKARRRRV